MSALRVSALRYGGACFRRSIPAILGLALLAAGCAFGGRSSWEESESPVAAPQFSLATLYGEPAQLSDYRGRIVVIEFWATWCGLCRQTLPSVELLQKKYRDRGVQMLLVNLAEDPYKVRKWAEDRLKCAILLDRKKQVARQYKVVGIPAFFVIDRQGRLRFTKRGYGGGLEQDLSGILDELLSEMPASSIEADRG